MAGNREKRDEAESASHFDYESDCRTECKYGADCYQKNPLHRKKFKHPSKRKSQDELNGRAKKTKNENVAKEEEKEQKDEKEKEVETCSVEGLNDDGLIITEENDEDDVNLTCRDRIKKRFLVEMPEDFYSFWDFIQHVKPETLKSLLGLILVGPYDMLAGKFKTTLKPSAYLHHWRYYYDPPEFQTLIAKVKNDSQFHIGYFRDDPNEMPSFVASNSASDNCIFTQMGPNLFAAVNAYIKGQLKDCKTKYSKIHLEDMKSLRIKLEKWATDHKFTLEVKTAAMKVRQKLVVTPSFHKAGIVVPVKDDVGYRPLPESDVKLKRLFQAIADSKTDEARNANFDKLHEILTLIQFANDECDYGMGLELAVDLFCFGGSVFHKTILNFMPLAYDLLRRPQYSQIIAAHLEDRKKEGNLSVLPS